MTDEFENRTLDVPGATLAYDVRGDLGDTAEPVLLLIGSPMDATGFGTLASYVPDRTIVTYDPRGTARSPRSDGAAETTPQEHAEDLHRVIEALGAGPVDLFASSGGAVNALELVARHPDDVRTLVAHEPPAVPVLPDAEHATAASQDIYDAYQRGGLGIAMAKFIALTSWTGPFSDEYLQQPAPDPAAFGLPTEDDGNRDDALMANLRACTAYRPDFDALGSATTRVVLAAGKESEGQLAARCAAEVAERLGRELVIFPSGHGGFLGDEYGMPGQPEAFAARLTEVLAQR